MTSDVRMNKNMRIRKKNEAKEKSIDLIISLTEYEYFSTIIHFFFSF